MRETYNEYINYTPSQYIIMETITYTNPEDEFYKHSPRKSKAYKIKTGIVRRYIKEDGKSKLLSQSDIIKWFNENEFDEMVGRTAKENNTIT